MQIEVTIRLIDTHLKVDPPLAVAREYKAWTPGSTFNERDVTKLVDVVGQMVDMEDEVPEMAAELGAAIHAALPVEDIPVQDQVLAQDQPPVQIQAAEEEQ